MAERGLPSQERLTDTEAFLTRYRRNWLTDSKESELKKLEAAFRWDVTGLAPCWEKNVFQP